MDENIRGYKILLSYDIKEQSSQAYYQFVLGEYVPAMQAFGFQMSEAWHTAFGDAPNRLIGFVCSDYQKMDDLVDDEKWLHLNIELEKYVDDFSYKVIPYRGGFQI